MILNLFAKLLNELVEDLSVIIGGGNEEICKADVGRMIGFV